MERKLGRMSRKHPAPDKSFPTISNDLENIRNLSNQIMHLALSGLLRIDFLNGASEILMEFTGSDSVVIVVKGEGEILQE